MLMFDIPCLLPVDRQRFDNDLRCAFKVKYLGSVRFELEDDGVTSEEVISDRVFQWCTNWLSGYVPVILCPQDVSYSVTTDMMGAHLQVNTTRYPNGGTTSFQYVMVKIEGYRPLPTS